MWETKGGGIALDPPSVCSGVEGRALQRRRESQVLRFHRGVGLQLLLLLNKTRPARRTRSKFSRGSGEQGTGVQAWRERVVVGGGLTAPLTLAVRNSTSVGVI